MRDDLETLVVDADLLEAILGTPDPKKKAKEIEIKVAKRLRNHLHDPRFKALAERLEDLRRALELYPVALAVIDAEREDLAIIPQQLVQQGG